MLMDVEEDSSLARIRARGGLAMRAGIRIILPRFDADE